MEVFKAVANSLPSHEAGLIRQAHKHLNVKQYQKALKQIEKVLENQPNHGETLVFKAVVLNTLGKKAEALDLAKQGLMKNLKSFLCWHGLSLIYNTEKNFVEAYKTTQKAYNIDPSNNYVVRNLSFLQIQLRDYEGFRDTRKTLMLSNPAVFLNWVSYAVGEYLCSNLTVASHVLDSFLNSMGKNLSKQELSEVVLFKARVLYDLQDYSGAVHWLDQHKDSVLDSIVYREKLAAALAELQDPRAEEVLLELLELNPDNDEYYALYQKAKPQDPFTLFTELRAKFPRAALPWRLSLDVVPSAQFLEAFDAYLRPRLVKGIPSLFADVRALIARDAAGVARLLTAHVSSLEQSEAFAEFAGEAWTPSEEKQLPHVLLWVLLLQARCHDLWGDHAAAHAVIDKAIEHTPTLPDLYLAKARFCKHTGDLAQAVHFADKARKFDLADRYVNNFTAKYMLRHNQTAQAEEVMALFSRERGEELNVHDMQSMWYELEVGEAWLRLGNYEAAVRELKFVEQHLVDMYDDQADFHFYCMSKMNLNTYVDFLRFEDRLMTNKNLLRAGLGLLTVYTERPDLFGLDQAFPLALKLLRHHQVSPALAPLAFRVFLAKRKFLLCLKCLLKSPSDELREELGKELAASPPSPQVAEVIRNLLG